MLESFTRKVASWWEVIAKWNNLYSEFHGCLRESYKEFVDIFNWASRFARAKKRGTANSGSNSVVRITLVQVKYYQLWILCMWLTFLTIHNPRWVRVVEALICALFRSFLRTSWTTPHTVSTSLLEEDVISVWSSEQKYDRLPMVCDTASQF